MGRIEEALARLRAQQSGGPRMVAEAARSEVLETPLRVAKGGAVVHEYGGRRVEVAFDALRAKGLLAADADDVRVTEEYRIVKRPLLKNASPELVPRLPRGNLILVASALPGEGKTFTSVNLCLSLAREQDWTVVLVDGDSNKPQLSRSFGIEREPGLMDLLRNPSMAFDSVVMPTNVPNLSLVSAGEHREDSVELLSSTTMDALCNEVSSADTKRLIVFDSPPMLLTSEAPALAAHMSQVVMVVQANKTPRRAVIAALNRLDSSRAIGLLLNQVDKSSASEYGAYGYGYGD